MWTVAGGKALQDGAGKLLAAAGGQQAKKKRKRRAGIVGAGITIVAVGAGACLMFFVLLLSMIGAVGGGSAAEAVISSSCGANRAPITLQPGTPVPGAPLTGIVPGSMANPMAAGSYVFSSPFGMRWGLPHNGVDFAAPIGTPIYAAAEGDVVEAGPASGFGLWIRVMHTINGQPVETVYGHMETINVATGQHVTAGQQIATVGTRGNSTGPHLHFEVHPGGHVDGGGVDPMPWLKQEGTAADTTTSSAAPATTTAAPVTTTAAPTTTRAPPATTTSPPPTTTTSTAPADPDIVTAADWERLAECEAGGNWATNTGNGFYGGLQFTLQTWEAFGGKDYADTPDKASKEQQMEVANKVLVEQGWGAWPTCSANQGLTGKKAAPAGTFVAGNGSQPTPTPNVQNAAAVTPPANCPGTAVSTSQLQPGTVPSPYVQAVIAAGKVCPEVSSPLIAGQLEQESSWNPDVVSADPDGAGPDEGGAQGMSQFMPGTWATQGIDSKLDKNGQPETVDTPADPFNPYDAIASQASYDCKIAEILRPKIADGSVICPDIADCILAGYNAGESAVLNYGGVPPFPQTQAYVVDIKERMKNYTAIGTAAPQPGAAQPFTVSGSQFAQALIAAASTHVGLPYIWGGGDQNGPTGGGFDCSGLVLYAVAQASNGTIILPHLTNEQVLLGHPVDKNNIQPGDAVFSNGTGHVAIWLGDGKVLEAQTFGVPVGVHPFDLANAEDIRRYG